MEDGAAEVPEAVAEASEPPVGLAEPVAEGVSAVDSASPPPPEEGSGALDEVGSAVLLGSVSVGEGVPSEVVGSLPPASPSFCAGPTSGCLPERGSVLRPHLVPAAETELP